VKRVAHLSRQWQCRPPFLILNEPITLCLVVLYGEREAVDPLISLAVAEKVVDLFEQARLDAKRTRDLGEVDKQQTNLDLSVHA